MTDSSSDDEAAAGREGSGAIAVGDTADPRPLGGYAALLATYSMSIASALWLLRKRRTTLPRIDLRRMLVLALATQHLSRLIAKDSITAPLRAPFTAFVEPAGEGEVNEAVIGDGVRHAIGELVSCPFCLGQWIASALALGMAVMPELTEWFATICALARVSDFFQLGYDALKPET